MGKAKKGKQEVGPATTGASGLEEKYVVVSRRRGYG